MIKVRLNNIKSPYKELQLLGFPVYSTTEVNGVTKYSSTVSKMEYIKINDDSITIKVNESDARLLSVDDSVTISRYEGDTLVSSEELIVLSVTNDFVTLSMPSAQDVTYGVSEYKATVIKGNLIQNSETILSADASTGITTGSTAKTFDLSCSAEEIRGKKITVSVEVGMNNAKNSNGTRNRVGFEFSAKISGVSSNNNVRYYGIWESIPTGATTLHKRISTACTVDSRVISIESVGIYIQNLGSGSVTVSNPKVEINDVATKWISCQEDIYDELSLTLTEPINISEFDANIIGPSKIKVNSELFSLNDVIIGQDKKHILISYNNSQLDNIKSITLKNYNAYLYDSNIRNGSVFFSGCSRNIGQWAAPSGSKYLQTNDYSYITMGADGQMSIYTEIFNDISTTKWANRRINISVMVNSPIDDDVKTGVVVRDTNGVIATNLFNNYYSASYVHVKANQWTKVTSTFVSQYNIDDIFSGLTANRIYFVVGSKNTAKKDTVYKFKEWRIEFDCEDIPARVTFSKYNAFLNMAVPISNSTSYNSLHQQENIDLYFNKLVENSVPKIIDTERIKYVPYLTNDNLAQKLEFNFHFRRRNTVNGKYKMSDNWDIETEDNFNGAIGDSSDEVYYWNTFKDCKNIGTGDTLYQSDLLGYLGFTDSDVYNRKQKLKKSFIRLSFYATNNPVENSLLFYSTIFFNTNKLYTNYINLLNNDDYPTWENKYLKGESGSTDYNYWGLVFFDGSNGNNKISYDKLLNSQIRVTNEFDKTTSAEGYNLYLYKGDADIEKEQIIYMKVEFNHAGYGRTIPMVLWPKDGDNKYGGGLTQENVYDQMYIPVHLKYDTDAKRFVYYFEDNDLGIKNNTEGQIIQFALFEPKLEPDK